MDNIQMKINEAIDFLGLNDMAVCIHASLKSFDSYIPNLLEIFLEAGCTVLVPTFSDMFETHPIEGLMPEQNGAGDYSYFINKEYVDNVVYSTESNELTVEEMGMFPQMVLEKAGRVRGKNALNSFTAVGAMGRKLVQNQTNHDVYAPLEELYELDGYVLLIGVGLDSATAIHYAEQKAGRMPFVRWSKDPAGNTIAVRAGGCSDGFEKLSPFLSTFEKTVTVFGSKWRCYKIRELVDVCEKEFRENANVAHCGDPRCERCNDAAKGGPIWF